MHITQVKEDPNTEVNSIMYLEVNSIMYLMIFLHIVNYFETN